MRRARSAAGIPVVEGGAALSDRVALTATVGATEPELVLASALVSGRWMATRGDQRVAITGQLAAVGFPSFGDATEYHLDPGVALDVGGPKVRFDAAIPVWGLSMIRGYVGVDRFFVPELSTMGVDFVLSDRNRLRLGLPELLSWSWRGEHGYVDVGGVTLLAVGAIWFKAGVVF